jgi:hypothetical protein
MPYKSYRAVSVTGIKVRENISVIQMGLKLYCRNIRRQWVYE